MDNDKRERRDTDGGGERRRVGLRQEQLHYWEVRDVNEVSLPLPNIRYRFGYRPAADKPLSRIHLRAFKDTDLDAKIQILH